MSVKRARTGRRRRPRRSLRGRSGPRVSAAPEPKGRAPSFREGAGFFFQLVASLADYAVITMDKNGLVSSWNPGAEQVFGFREEEIIGRPYSLLFSKEEQERGAPQRELDSALETGRGIDETWHVRKDGSKFWAAGVVFPLRDEHGGHRGFTKIAQDLTKGKLLGEAAEFTARVLHTVASSIPALVWYIDSNERVLFQNRPRLPWWRKEPTEVQDGPLSRALSEEAYRLIQPFIRHALAGRQKIFEVEMPVDGARRWVHVDSIPDLDPEGHARGMVCLVTDISDTRTIERELRESAASKDRLAAILITSSDAIVSKDLEGNIRTWNQGAERIFGYRAQDIIGKPMTTIIPRERLSEEREILRRLHEGKPYERMETIRLAKDGRQIHVSVSVWPVRDKDGRVVEAASILRDVTERKETEARLRGTLERLRESENRFSLLVRASSDALYRMSPDWSQMRQLEGGGFLTDTSESSGNWLQRYIPPEDQPYVMEKVDEAIRRKSTFALEHRVVRPDGSIGWVLSRAIPRLDETGKIVEWFGAGTDITARKAAEEAAAQAKGQLEEKVAERTEELRGTVEELERFSYTVAHDLRAPLRNVHHHVDRLRRKWPDMSRDAVEQDLNQIAAGALRMDKLIEDLLNYSRISSEKMSLAPQDLNAILGAIVGSLEPEIAERRAAVVVEPALPRALGDEFLLTQALSNLLTNALKFVPPDRTPEVRAGAEKKGARVVVWVQDNGIGIDPKYRDKVFGIFERLHPQESYPGTGIGLAISKRAAERMGGTVGFESTPGRGSRFWIALKAAPRA